jgi:hypothetical protein
MCILYMRLVPGRFQILSFQIIYQYEKRLCFQTHVGYYRDKLKHNTLQNKKINAGVI